MSERKAVYKQKSTAANVPLGPPFEWCADVPQNAASAWHNLVNLLASRRKIIVLTGAGISVSCGIPDFRSKTGLYATLDTQDLGLSCPEELFDIHFFREDPRPFYKFAKQLYFPGDGSKKVSPSDTHKLLARLDQEKKLLRVYSQNIDGLEETAGVSVNRIAYVHGSLKFATCESCRSKVPACALEADILAGRVARCQSPRSVPAPKTRTSTRKRQRPLVANNVCGGVLKPGVTFFGEALHDTVHTKLQADRDKVDALIVIGTSLSVAPISKVIEYLPKSIPRILINRNIAHPPNGVTSEERRNHTFDAYLLGNCDDVMRALGKALFEITDGHSGKAPCDLLSNLDESSQEMWNEATVARERVFLFPGAEPPKPISNAYHDIWLWLSPHLCCRIIDRAMADLFGEDDEDNEIEGGDDDDEEEEDILDMGEDNTGTKDEELLMRFCPHDSSMLYPQENRQSKTLQYACRLCEYSEPSADKPLIYRNEKKKEVKNILHTVPSAISDDPTLARSNRANCSNCGHNEAVFFQSDVAQADSLALIFVCCNCDFKWVG